MSKLFSGVLFVGVLWLLCGLCFILRFYKIVDVITLNKLVIGFQQLIYPRQTFPFGRGIAAFGSYLVDVLHNVTAFFYNTLAVG